MNWELPDVQAGFRKGRGTKDQIAKSAGSLKKQESSRKTSISALLSMPKPLTVWITKKCGKFWKRWEYQTTWSVSWETCMQVRMQQLEQYINSRLVPNRKRSMSGCILSSCLFNLNAEYLPNARLDEAQAGIKIAGRNTNNLRYTDDTTLMAESEEELKSLLMKVKEESVKAGLKLNIQKTKIMASGPITSWQIDGETVTDFLCWPPKSLLVVTAAMKLKDTCSLEGKLWPN